MSSDTWVIVILAAACLILAIGTARQPSRSVSLRRILEDMAVADAVTCTDCQWDGGELRPCTRHRETRQ